MGAAAGAARAHYAAGPVRLFESVMLVGERLDTIGPAQSAGRITVEATGLLFVGSEATVLYL